MILVFDNGESSFLEEKISDFCIEIFKQHAWKIKGQNQDDFDHETIDAESKEIEVANWEAFSIAMAYCAELHLYERPIDFEGFNINEMREKIIDIFVQLLGFD